MSDIRYKWNDGLNSVQVSGDVSLPQFKVITWTCNLQERTNVIDFRFDLFDKKGIWVTLNCDFLKWRNLIFSQLEFRQLWIQSYQLKLTDNLERSEMKSCSLSFTQFPSILPNFGKLPRNAASLILPFAAMPPALNSIFWTWLFRADISFYIVFLIWHFQQQSRPAM